MTKEQKRLRVNGVIVAIFGLVFALTVLTPLYPATKLFLNIAHWPFNEAPAALDPSARLLLAISGGLTAGIGAMMWTVGTDVMPVAPEAGRRVVLYTAVVWFTTDSTFSVVAGSPVNVALNVTFLILMLGSLDLKRPVHSGAIPGSWDSDDEGTHP